MINLKKLPIKPGIYKFLDKQGHLLYIGKAKNLKNRIKSYFAAPTARQNYNLGGPGRAIPLRLPKFSPALQLLQAMRDEAHRFAINYYRKLHSKQTLKS